MGSRGSAHTYFIGGSARPANENGQLPLGLGGEHVRPRRGTISGNTIQQLGQQGIELRSNDGSAMGMTAVGNSLSDQNGDTSAMALGFGGGACERP